MDIRKVFGANARKFRLALGQVKKLSQSEWVSIPRLY